MLTLLEIEKRPNQQGYVSRQYLVNNIGRVRAYLTRLNEQLPYKGGFDELATMSDTEVIDEYLHVRMVEETIE